MARKTGPGDPAGVRTSHRGDKSSIAPHLSARHGKGQRDAGAQDTASGGGGGGKPAVMRGAQAMKAKDPYEPGS